MSEHLSLETCKRLKAAGYPQDQWPQMVWYVWTSSVMGEQQSSEFWEHDYGKSHIACPPIITSDGKGGVLPWLVAKLYDEAIINFNDGDWSINWREVGAIPHVSPEELIIGGLDFLESAAALKVLEANNA